MKPSNDKLIEEWLDRACRYEEEAMKWPPSSYWHKQGMHEAQRAFAVAEQYSKE